MRKKIVQLEKVTKIFEDRQVKAIENISFEVLEGEFVSIIGPSGCGKTTILQMIADLDDPGPSFGKILIDGKTPKEARKEGYFGIVFQESALLPHLSPLGNVLIALRISRNSAGKTKQEKLKIAYKLLEKVRLDPKFWKNYYPYQLSGGMKQRVAIARALAVDPKLLLMDEPFGALDALTREEMNFELLRIWQESNKLTVIFVTHSIEEAVLLSDRIIVLSSHPGRVVDEVKIDLSRPRSRLTKENSLFTKFVNQTRNILEQGNNNSR